MAPKRPTFHIVVTLALVVTTAAYHGCGGEDPPSGPDGNNGPPDETVDTIPPADIEDIITTAPGAGSLALQWVSPGDDGWEGTALSYDVRYSETGIDESTWEFAEPFGDPPPPVPGRQIQICRVYGLDAKTLYHFAIKTRDEAGNESGLSKVVSDTTGQEQAPPGDVTDLTAVAVDSLSFLLTWTAPGDDASAGTAAGYDIRYRLFSGVTESNWASSTEIDNEPLPKPFGEPESLIVSVATPNTNHGFALKAHDEVPLWSDISNVCLALGSDTYVWSFPFELRKGRDLTVIYRAPGGEHVRVELHYYYAGDPCGLGDIVLFDGTPAGGTYTLTYDFFDPGTQDYHRRGTYHLYVCINGTKFGTSRVDFVD